MIASSTAGERRGFAAESGMGASIMCCTRKPIGEDDWNGSAPESIS